MHCHSTMVILNPIINSMNTGTVSIVDIITSMNNQVNVTVNAFKCFCSYRHWREPSIELRHYGCAEFIWDRDYICFFKC